LCIFYFPLLPKMHFVFLQFFGYFSIPSQIALCPSFFSVFRDAVKEQNREFTCCISFLLAISPAAWLYLFLGLYFFGTFFCILMITGSTVCSQHVTTEC
jgi:hypothetical protein